MELVARQYDYYLTVYRRTWRGTVVSSFVLPVLFLADSPVTGGYPVVAVVRDADLDRAAQLRPGQPVRFRLETR